MPVNTTGMVLAVSVTRNRTVSASFSRCTLPLSTKPPTRNARSRGTSLAATWVGVKKNTRFERKALSTSATAMPSAASPPTIHIALLVLGFKFPFLLDAAPRARTLHAQRDQLGHHHHGGRTVRHPKIEGVLVHSALAQRVRRSRSRMIERTRVIDAPIAYIQNANAISSIPQSIATCIEVPRKLTLDPWWSVFHQGTEK